MDRGKAPVLTRSALLVLLAALQAPATSRHDAGAGEADPIPLPVAEARWVTPEARLQTLTRLPPECLAWPVDKEARQSVAIGRAAFRAPLLLGGQAARAGLSCASCHRNGRGNPHFQFPGLSGAPGTADITSSLMSRKRGDGIVNPKPIPDLAAATNRIPRDRSSNALETFIHGLIVEEFDGPEPPVRILAGLADYVRAMSSGRCRGTDRPIRLRAALAEVRDALEPATSAASAGDAESMRVLVGAARSALGRIDQRYQVDGLEADRALLRKADAELASISRMASGTAARAISRWQASWPLRLRGLTEREHLSLYSLPVIESRLRPS